ncbi:MAG: hypothetical protein RLZZ338_2947 [Cyanobacteriota bacterium]|jgi:hypothetical protein
MDRGNHGGIAPTKFGLYVLKKDQINFDEALIIFFRLFFSRGVIVIPNENETGRLG